jgi:hypothetical protein|tara:strand:- start:200 stop:355 length:156 start_codon:yes stop_codon:yes gene_type:complete
VEGDILNNIIAFLLTILAGMFAYYTTLEVEERRRDKRIRQMNNKDKDQQRR